MLRIIYYYGFGVKKDYSKAKALFEQAAEANNNSEAFLRLG